MATVLNSDIYNISDLILKLEKEYTGESDETLSVGTYGFITALESKKIQKAIILSSEFANEAFPTKARLEKNVITHAITYNIENINAIPATMEIVLALRAADLEGSLKNNTFTIDRESPIYIGNYEFHLDYDIILSKSVLAGNNSVYTARYDISRENTYSNIVNPYLPAPGNFFIGNETFLFIECAISQVHHEIVYSKLVTNNPIDNKTINFKFTDQLSYFEVHIVEGEENIYLTPIFEGGSIPEKTNYYCWYVYIDENNVRVKFDRNSYMPGLNAEVEILIKTTKGKSGNFKYNDNVQFELKSSKYNYKGISAQITPRTSSENGKDRKSKSELQSLLPKEIAARGSLTMISDLNNYFNMINNEKNLMVVQKKIDNQIERTYYAYLVLKDRNDNIIPTNTIDIKIGLDQFTGADNNRYVLRAGSCIKFNKNWSGEVVDPSDMIEGEFYYTNPYTVVVNKDHLYSAYYMMIMNMDPLLSFSYINQSSKLQFISETVHWERKFLTDIDRYNLSITTTQNINKDMGVIVIDRDINNNDIEYIKENNMKVIAVFYKNGKPYRYKEAKLTNWDMDVFAYDWDFNLKSKDTLDENNDIRIEDLGVPGSLSHDYGYMSPTTEVKIYVLVKFDDDYGRYDLDPIVPGLEGYSVCNIYGIHGGLVFYYNYSEIMGSRVRPIGETTIVANTVNVDTSGYYVSSVPVFGYQYSQDEYYIADAITQLNFRKAYIENAVTLLENSFGIDFKLFNTYGPSRTFTLDGSTYLNKINITLTFRLKLVTAVDMYTRDYIVKDIKEYIENLNNIGSIHIPNLITQITSKYKDSIIYFEFVSINEYGPGNQHIIKDNDIAIHTVPEFININNVKGLDGKMVPDINIHIVS